MSFLRNSCQLITNLRQVGGYINYAQCREVKRWVSPTLKELRRRRQKLGAEPAHPRSTFIEWNYAAELYAFGKRLHEEFDINKLQEAFVCRSYILQEEVKQREVGIEEPKVDIKDNTNLTKKGEQIISEYVNAFLIFSLPKVPEEGISAIYKFLTSDETLAHVSSHLGTKDLILCADFPPEQTTMVSALQAIVGALAESSGNEQAYTFVRDFICTQLNQKDLTECWNIENPLEMLQKICSERKLAEPEPRLIGESGKNTVLAVYEVGIYSNKKLLGRGFGESVDVAIHTAALDTLRDMFDIHDNRTPFNFSIQLERLENKDVKQLRQTK